MFSLLVLGMIVNIQSAPVAGPNYDNIQYLHNLTLTYSNNSLEGLGAIDNFTDVSPEIAQSLKSAINQALPAYLASSRTSSPTASGFTGTPEASGTSGSLSATTIQASTAANLSGRKKRDTASSSSPSPSATASTSGSSTQPLPTSSATSHDSSPSPSSAFQSEPSTTQPYGTDEEFYARTDLVHFHVDINDLEGSGAI